MLTYNSSAGDECMEKTQGVRILEQGMKGYRVITSHRWWTEQDPLTSVWSLLWTPPGKPFFSRTDPTDAQKFLVYTTRRVIRFQHTPPLSEKVIFSDHDEMCPHQVKSHTWRRQMFNTNKSHKWSQGTTEFTQVKVYSFLQSLCSRGLFQSYRLPWWSSDWLHASTAGGMGSVPGQGTQIPACREVAKKFNK